MEKFKEQCQEEIHSIKQSQEAELQSHEERVSEYIMAMNMCTKIL